jgi:hypothetical protein
VVYHHGRWRHRDVLLSRLLNGSVVAFLKSHPDYSSIRTGDRETVFALLRDALTPEACARVLSQWSWRCDANPSAAAGPAVNLLLLDGELVGFAGFRVKMWMGREVCDGEATIG